MSELSLESGIPKYVQIRDILRASLERGEWAPGDRLPSCRELTQRFEVTPMTVWQAIGELDREGLVERVRGLGTFACEPAATVAAGLVGVATRTTGDSFGATAEALVHELAACGRTPLWLGLEGPPDELHPQWRRRLEMLLASQPQALVLDGVAYLPFDFLRDHADDLPPLTFMRVCETDVAFPAANRIVCDWEAGGFLAASHLLAQGVDRLTYVTFGDPPKRPQTLGHPYQFNSLVLDGIQRALRTAGADPGTALRVVLDTIDAPARPGLTATLAAGFRGVIALGDTRACKVYRAADEQGLTVGRDVLVCGYYDTHWAPLQQPPLTSVNINEPELATTVARAVSEGWQGRTVRIPPALIGRESTGISSTHAVRRETVATGKER